jgi:CRISPR-associated endoribonuclease Cas6
MRYKLILKLVDPLRNILPVNYQYELGAWFYRMVNLQESNLSNYLISNGLLSPDKPFRSFVFSNLMVPDRKIEGDRLSIQSEKISLLFSTLPDEGMVPLVKENFQDLRFMLGDRISQVSFAVENIELQPEPIFTDKMTFKTLSPLHLTMKMHGRKNELFLSPETPGYCSFFYGDLHKKFKILNGYDHPHDPLAGKFKLRSPVTQKGITLQSGHPGQNKLIGYQLRFRLQADPELLKAGYYLGFGEKNHLGFGCCEIL